MPWTENGVTDAFSRPSPIRDTEESTVSPRHSNMATLRQGLSERRLARRERASVARELADYDTPAQRQDLDAILDRHPGEEVRVIMGIRCRQAISTQ